MVYLPTFLVVFFSMVILCTLRILTPPMETPNAIEWDVRTDRRTSKGPQFPNPLFCFGRQSGGRRSTVLFWWSALPRTRFFLGGTIDDKKGMRGHGMGCQNWPKNEHELSTLPQKTVWWILIDVERRRWARTALRPKNNRKGEPWKTKPSKKLGR